MFYIDKKGQNYKIRNYIFHCIYLFHSVVEICFYTKQIGLE